MTHKDNDIQAEKYLFFKAVKPVESKDTTSMTVECQSRGGNSPPRLFYHSS